MTLKKASDLKLIDFNHVAIDGTIKKACNSNNNIITKKETQILFDYFNGLQVSQGKLDKLHKPAQKILENKDMDVEDKIEVLYGIEIQFTFTGQDKIQLNDYRSKIYERKERKLYGCLQYPICSRLRYQTNLCNKRHTKLYRPL